MKTPGMCRNGEPWHVCCEVGIMLWSSKMHIRIHEERKVAMAPLACFFDYDSHPFRSGDMCGELVRTTAVSLMTQRWSLQHWVWHHTNSPAQAITRCRGISVFEPAQRPAKMVDFGMTSRYPNPYLPLMNTSYRTFSLVDILIFTCWNHGNSTWLQDAPGKNFYGLVTLWVEAFGGRLSFWTQFWKDEAIWGMQGLCWCS